MGGCIISQGKNSFHDWTGEEKKLKHWFKNQTTAQKLNAEDLLELEGGKARRSRPSHSF